MPTESSSSRSNSTADSDIGSEVRYEGGLGDIRCDDVVCNTIAKENVHVRSSGAERPEKDGLQVLLSDNLLEYMLSRGRDIKDLQVKSSPPVQPTPASPIHDVPVAMQRGVPFQTHYGQRGREKGRGARVSQIHCCSNQSFCHHAGDDEDNNEQPNEAATTGMKIPSKLTAMATKAPTKSKKSQALKLLSFTDDDIDEETQSKSGSKSSSSSHKISSLKDHQLPTTPLPSNVVPQTGTYTKEALLELQKKNQDPYFIEQLSLWCSIEVQA